MQAQALVKPQYNEKQGPLSWQMFLAALLCARSTYLPEN